MRQTVTYPAACLSPLSSCSAVLCAAEETSDRPLPRHHLLRSVRSPPHVRLARTAERRPAVPASAQPVGVPHRARRTVALTRQSPSRISPSPIEAKRVLTLYLFYISRSAFRSTRSSCCRSTRSRPGSSSRSTPSSTQPSSSFSVCLRSSSSSPPWWISTTTTDGSPRACLRCGASGRASTQRAGWGSDGPRAMSESASGRVSTASFSRSVLIQTLI